MTARLIAFTFVLLAAAHVRADSVEDHLTRARDLHDRGDFPHARDELLAAFRLDPRPELLFALGQVEFNLGNYKAAIDYYQRFNATNPTPEQGALAEQGIGAARIKLAQPPPPKPGPPPPIIPPPHREWDFVDGGVAALGGLSILVGGGLLFDSHQLAGDHTGSLRTYNSRVATATTARLAGAICGGAGALAIGIAVVRWRLHLVDAVIEVHASSSEASVTLERAL